jgi:cGMP-dependent protein kinase
MTLPASTAAKPTTKTIPAKPSGKTAPAKSTERSASPKNHMGAGASSNAVGKVRVDLTKEKREGIGGAMDASDIKSLEEAKEEIRRLRQIAKEAFKKDDDLEARKGTSPSVASNPVTAASFARKKEARAAVMARGSDKEYVKVTIPKSNSVRNLIYQSIKRNILFRSCSEEELHDLIDAFNTATLEAGAVVIKQGDEGDLFYVVEQGKLDIFVATGSSQQEVLVGAPYVSGSSFGELALMYGSPRAATIRAKSDCVLWSLDQRAFKGISTSHKQKRDEIILDTLRKVKIGDSVLGDVLEPSELDAMALATQSDSFFKGDVIIRQGEKGDAFYIIKSGTIDVFIKDKGDEPVVRLTSGQFFGEKALMSEDVRQATCIAFTDAECLTLMREDFVQMLGSLEDLLRGVDRSPSSTKEVTEDDFNNHCSNKEEMTITRYKLEDLDIRSTLGVGAFGRVKLAKVKPDKIPNYGNSNQTFALKCLRKRGIVDNGLQGHVVNECSLMKELNHPFILKFYGAMQDEHTVYFLLEILLGGELFRTLRREGQFSENWSRFYAASVILAFCQIHSKKIAYRDLKPENLVMDAQGYLKIVDFGLAKKLESGKTYTLCGTPDYLAPEVILNEGHDWAVDWWGLGVLIHEMTAGVPPFYAEDPMEVYERILSGHVSTPSHFSRGLGDLVKKLLKTTQSKRLGRIKGGASLVMKQKWFSGFDWNSLLDRKMEVPLKPDVKNLDDTSNFDSYDEVDESSSKVSIVMISYTNEVRYLLQTNAIARPTKFSP